MTICAAWPGIVGNDVAAASRPVAIVGGALVVVTASSQWSHQLSFLERTILADVKALGVEVDRLRFRVSALATHGE